MWHEARKQEKKIRGLLVDYRRRAERRRDYYEKIVRFRMKHQFKMFITTSVILSFVLTFIIHFLKSLLT